MNKLRASSNPIKIILVILVASLAFTIWGFLWYATVFDDVWQSLIGHSEEELIRVAEKRGIYQTISTHLISIVQASGLYAIIRMTRSQNFWQHQMIAGILSVLIALPVLGNAVLFANSPMGLWVLDFMHFIFGYAGMALIFWILKGWITPKQSQ